MHTTHDFLSLQEMDDLINTLKKTKDYFFYETDNNEEVRELTEQVKTSLTILIKLSQRRRTKLMKLFRSIERERAKILSELDLQNLSEIGNSERAQKLEKLINKYFYLNEGVKRSRSTVKQD